ncbi:hypothetical protein FA15DRAFT_405213 [Coprinopsis marcescibilis]|uniref:Uncharacterized protein n=1 Tax=Coprinopsis marcescibilis TaxID=230819 RepID=A0A5C3K9M2_COPMA|nr:hypothetical protein FA15DRAFT_405213 [Coprinopsis marcescibilis]
MFPPFERELGVNPRGSTETLERVTGLSFIGSLFSRNSFRYISLIFEQCCACIRLRTTRNPRLHLGSSSVVLDHQLNGLDIHVWEIGTLTPMPRHADIFATICHATDAGAARPIASQFQAWAPLEIAISVAYPYLTTIFPTKWMRQQHFTGLLATSYRKAPYLVTRCSNRLPKTLSILCFEKAQQWIPYADRAPFTQPELSKLAEALWLLDFFYHGSNGTCIDRFTGCHTHNERRTPL